MEIKSIIKSRDFFGILVDDTLHITRIFFKFKENPFYDISIADGQYTANHACLGPCCTGGEPEFFRDIITQAISLGAKRISYQNGLQISYENNWGSAGEILGLPFEEVPLDKREVEG